MILWQDFRKNAIIKKLFKEEVVKLLASKMLLSTLKEAPNEAKIASHILLLRAGMIKNEVAGVYNYLPLGLKTLTKIEQIIKKHMDKSGSLEIVCSAIQPKEYWEESGRWNKYGPELIRFSDRHEREFCLGPTHEEVFTTLAKDLIKSSKSLPVILYQIQTKYRDEVRPRFGLMRAREFIMKDAYSFDKDEEGLNNSYELMRKTYEDIFNELGLRYEIVLADTGAIGGNGSHQFMALSEIGESEIAYCECGYAADTEKATSKVITKEISPNLPNYSEVDTPNVKTILDLANYLNVKEEEVLKAVAYKDLLNNKLAVVFVRGDKEVNPIKVINKLNTTEANLVMASYEDILNMGSVDGFIGPIGLKNCEVLVDEEVTYMPSIVTGANLKDKHLKNVLYGRDFKGIVDDYRLVKAGDLCPVCGKPLQFERGIEVGQIFKLGDKYSKPMKAYYVDEDNKNVPYVMGCYGIGVTRTLQAIVEQYHDDYGIKWPVKVAPYHVVILPVNDKDLEQVNLANKLYEECKALNMEVILDDRSQKLGFKLKDWELIGIPFIVICGKKAGEGVVELKRRYKDDNKEEVEAKKLVSLLEDEINAELRS